MLAGAGPGRARPVPAGGWGSAPRAARIAAGLESPQAIRLAGEAQGQGGGGDVPGGGPGTGTRCGGGVPAAIAVEVARLRLERALAADAAVRCPQHAAAGRKKP